MGSENHVVVDISSDEEDDKQVDGRYFEWLNEVLEAVDEKSDNSDEVEVISEVRGSIDSVFRNPNLSCQAVDDDDCVILDGDPDKTTTTASGDDDDKLAKNDDDDVLVVGQKGEIACRDFPHPRHSCAKHPFNSTSHDKYCDMCHCYVCDIPAPCPYWYIGGVSTVEHCHASDKEKIWKNQREYFRTGHMPTEPSPKPTIPPPPPSMPPSILIRKCLRPPPVQNLIKLSTTLPLNQAGIRPCSSSSSTAKSRCRIKQVVPQRPVPSLSVRNNLIQKDRSPRTINLRSRTAVSGTRLGSTTGKSNAQVPQSINHSSSIVAPPKINLGTYTPLPRSYCATAMSGQNTDGGNRNRQFQTNAADLLAPPVTPLTATAAAVSSTVQQQQQPGANENVLLSEVESWLLMDQTGPVCPLTEPINQEQDQSLTFDFERILNDY